MLHFRYNFVTFDWLGANIEAKRAARAHFTFKVIGVIWMLILFVPLTAMVWNIAEPFLIA